ncbi:MAG: MATE family efflux transporter [Acidobacteria bacterium]|nr:MATE family efflux transporter [Acidobacteriota bacterium]MYA46800.1 MATE family efflux transporter [Acidobacteriota bacterium]MYI39543.1 MATE family efflux transporter [Acidobacteriota bacterium]
MPLGSRTRRVLALVVEALRGSDRDLTSGPLTPAVFVLAVPMALEMVGESIFAVVDAFFIARLGAASLASAGITETALDLVYAIAIGFSFAVTAVVSRRVGEGDRRGAARAGVQAIGLGLVVSVALGALGVIFAPRVLGLMGADAETVAVGTPHARIMYAGMATIILLFLNNAILRGAGDAQAAMRALWVSNGINIVLDPCLIFGLGPFPELGLPGAAVATTIGRGTGVLYQFWILTHGSRLRIRRADIRTQWGVLRNLCRVSVGGIAQMLADMLPWILLIRIIASFGTIAVAGWVIAIRVALFVILPCWGLSNAASTLVGQNLGAGKPDRAERAVWITSAWNMGFMALVTGAFVAFAPDIARIFTDDPEVLGIAATALRVVSYGYVFYALGMVTRQAFNGAGDTRTPTWIDLFCFWLFEIPAAWLLSRTALGVDGVFWAVALAYSLSAVVSTLVFRRGGWKTTSV